MKTNFFYSLAISAALSMAGCTKSDMSNPPIQSPPSSPTLTTSTVSNITQTTAQTGGDITKDNGASVIERGVVWDTSANPTIALSTRTNDGAGLGSFTSDIIDLLPNTTYHLRAYATNSVGTSYCNQLTFSTLRLEPDSSFVDPRDGKTYTFRHMPGGQVWMTQNLDYVVDGSWCYDDDPANCAIYGRLYTWSAALSAAPPGWHLPALIEWSNFIAWDLGGNYDGGGKMKEAGTAHWLSPNTNANNSIGFTALPGGIRWYDGSFIGLQENGQWWIDQSCGSGCAMGIWITYDNGMVDGDSSGGTDVSNGLSVRCIRD